MATKHSRLISYSKYVVTLNDLYDQQIGTKAVSTFFQDDSQTWQSIGQKIPEIDGHDDNCSDEDGPEGDRIPLQKSDPIQVKAVEISDSGTHHGLQTQQLIQVP